MLEEHTRRGFRVLALACRQFQYENGFLQVEKSSEKLEFGVAREALERDLHFQGFLVMENRIRTESPSVIDSLNAAAVRTLMVTGLLPSKYCNFISMEKF